jgi:cytochrome d ubiquinol oxidase subunit II
MDLPVIWFVLIAVLWIGYLVLEGFDFGVGMLLPVLGRTPADRRVLLNSVGPFWDGNEVWILTAGGAMFAAFPYWYATLFSGFYLALLLILVALIIRALGFEYRAKIDDPQWRKRWDVAIVIGSAVPALLWGVALANIVNGVPIDAHGEYTGTLFTLLGPVGLLGGLTTVALFLTHGALFVALKTDGPIRVRARRIALRTGPVAALLAVVLFVVLGSKHGSVLSWTAAAVAAIALLAALAAAARGREGWSFAGTALTIGAAVVAMFAMLYPNVMPSTLDPAWSLTIHGAASSTHTLGIMTVVALIFTPIVLIYQGYTYWVFRRRISAQHVDPTVPVGLPSGDATRDGSPQAAG